MSGVVGLIKTVGLLLIHQRSLLSPWMMFRVLPTAVSVSAFYVF